MISKSFAALALAARVLIARVLIARVLIARVLIIGLAAHSLPAAQVPAVINVEIDYMVGAGHSHQPSQAVLDALVQMFACHGIVLNLELSDAIPHLDVIQCDDPASGSFWSCDDANSVTTLKDTYGDHNDEPGWHYCILGHLYDSGSGPGSSGRSNGTNVFLVTLAGISTAPPVGTDYQVAATFAHELGHDLGLGHASPLTVTANGPYAPNRASVMSYRYQLVGVRSRMECMGLLEGPHLYKDLDYSNGRLPRLDENLLSEARGVGIHAVDWNCNTILDPGFLQLDLDIDGPPAGGGFDFCQAPFGGNSILDDYDDWSNLSDVTHLPEAVRGDLVRSDYECITGAEFDVWTATHDVLHEARTRSEREPGGGGLNDPSLCPGNVTTLSLEACEGGRMYFVDPNHVGSQSGTGENPYTGLALPAALAPSGSVIYMQPGTSTNSGFPIVLDSPMILAGPGGAIVDP